MKLTRKEQASVLRAAEMVASDKALSIAHAITDTKFWDGFLEMYGHAYGEVWSTDLSLDEKRDIRVLCLLSFLEANR